MTDPLLCEIDGTIARVTLNRPDAFNAMDKALRDGFKEAISRIHKAKDVRVVILAGNGRGFSAGTDLKEGLVSPISLLLEQEYRPILAAISNSPKIWIAQVHGSAAGIGAAVAMNCDLMTMAEDATIYMAFAAIGLVPDGGNTWLLHRGLGYKRAMQAILEGRKIPAAEAVALGLANSAHAPETLAEDTTALAHRIAASAPLAASAAKRLLRQMDGMSYEASISAEAREQTDLTESEDAREAVQAFIEKRKPTFKGK
ncbi:enoyl-CoA hydratase/isomerase family protein [Maritimibacter sp. DP1N21-5]|uniref:enoyl-CoA hydratase/isomerase family protein n=1 Tax=Maritimibacter sp. DP1N21-5 TaxID=2836867 RepID=UPI001C47C53A|nr:enoyl-CoA hydratase-related protein [Maritimibacter sp. DP1N21-5]MBV7407810.1 enoyl-CoA hydratase/isomerase family protein [Maritimibacter sp. DP1N21-5]